MVLKNDDVGIRRKREAVLNYSKFITIRKLTSTYYK